MQEHLQDRPITAEKHPPLAIKEGETQDLPISLVSFSYVRNKYRQQQQKIYDNPEISFPRVPLSGRLMKKSGNNRRSRRGFGIYIHRTLRRVKPNCQISKKAMLVMDSFMQDMLQRVAGMAAQLVVIQGRKTLICQDIETAVKLLLSGELMLHAVSEGTKAYARYTGRPRV